MALIAVLGLFVLELFNLKLYQDRKIFNHPLKQIIPIISVLIILLIWYKYAIYYNSINNSGIFLIGYMPIWDLDLSEIKLAFEAIDNHITWDYFRKETQIVFIIIFVSVMIFYKKLNKLMLFFTIFLSIGFVLFILLFFQALKFHDYYATNLFVVIPIVLLSFLLTLKNKFKIVYSSVFFRIIVVVFLIYNISFAKRMIEERYNPKSWHNEYYVKNLKTFEEITPYLRTVGIKKNDKVISLSDESINISLYLMNQKGWTNYGLMSDSTRIKEKIVLGAKYLLIYNKEIYEDQSIQPFIKNKIGEFKNIDIYAL
jgi:hypothetical protein